MLKYLIKGGFIASFFLSATSLAYATALFPTQAVYKLSQSKEWHALLHLKNNQFLIKDTHFFLSKGSRDPLKELKATMQAFKSQPASLADEHPICRFPARFSWLKKQLNFQADAYPKPNCRQYKTFLRKAPVQDISLVFASANVSSPISMMGHSFLKLSGQTSQGRYTEHAVTFYTML
ncbi:MAG: DUF4105 domain-containing protein, partial [Ghiorsea sp.]|nr:DUF4105 domain-containing protein [Ghiorsea sp.]